MKIHLPTTDSLEFNLSRFQRELSEFSQPLVKFPVFHLYVVMDSRSLKAKYNLPVTTSITINTCASEACLEYFPISRFKSLPSVFLHYRFFSIATSE